AGAAYLGYLGVQTIRHRRDGGGVVVDETPRREPAMRIVRQGFVVGVTNPKTIVFFVAVLPQFVDVHRGGPVPVQMMVLGVTFLVIAIVCDSAWALLASVARGWFARSPKRLSTIRGVGGGMMIGLGGVLAFTSRS
ncbi:LysE family translocator, partial [Mesorhizobium japonicum]|uniref:LysE family translocator n=1 Tax=Mesorhizobium japonicum TaxID=2066070 RepID=UPI003B596142